MKNPIILSALLVLAAPTGSLAQPHPGPDTPKAGAPKPTGQGAPTAPAAAAPAQPDPAQAKTPAPTAAEPAPAAAAQPAPATAQPTAATPAQAGSPGTPTEPEAGAPTGGAATPQPQAPGTGVAVSAESRARWQERVRQSHARTQQAAARARAWRPREPRFTFGLGVNSRFYTDSTYGLYGEDDATGAVEVFASYDFYRPTAQTVLAAEVGYGYEEDGSNGVVGGALDTQLESHHVHAGVNLRYELLSFLQPHVRLAAGLSVVDSAIDVRGAGFTAEEDLVTPFLRAGAGFTARLPPGLIGRSPFDGPGERSLTLGLRIEGGYILTKRMSVDLQQEEIDGTPIPIEDANLGSFRRHGLYVMGALVGSL